MGKDREYLCVKAVKREDVDILSGELSLSSLVLKSYLILYIAVFVYTLTQDAGMMNEVLYFLWIMVAYPYVIYPFFSFLISHFSRPRIYSANTPSVTVLIPAYNEVSCISEKLRNTFSLEYPADKLKVMVVTDGSFDGTDTIVAADGRALLLHDTERRGKAGAINRALAIINTDVVVCTDANTLLNREALQELMKYFQYADIGAVAGSKRVIARNNEAELIAEGMYWHYESKLREWDAATHSVTGAVGELYAIRTELLKPIPEDTICDDLLIATRVIEAGKRVVYEPGAYGKELISVSISDEWKRKRRIAAGSIQFFQRLKLFRFCINQPYPAFQLISRKFFRWLIVPYLLMLLLPVSILVFLYGNDAISIISSFLVLVFFVWGLAGWILSRAKNLSGIFYFPFYFLMTNVAIMAGTFQYLNGKSFAIWEKSAR